MISDLASAIIRFENVDPNRGLNNPGAIWDMQTNGLKRYNTYEEGYAAMVSLITNVVNKGVTLREFFGGKPGVYPGYAPYIPGTVHASNNPDHYAETVAGWLGINPDVPINTVMNSTSNSSPGTNTNTITQSNVNGLFNSSLFDIELSNYLTLPNLGTYTTSNLSYSTLLLLVAASFLTVKLLQRVRGAN